MTQSFSVENESRLRGALGSLEQAAVLLAEALGHGPCPRAASNTRDAENLAIGASTMLSYVVGKGSW